MYSIVVRSDFTRILMYGFHNKEINSFCIYITRIVIKIDFVWFFCDIFFFLPLVLFNISLIVLNIHC